MKRWIFRASGVLNWLILTAALAVAGSGCVPEEMRLRYNPESAEPMVRIAAILPLSGDKRALGEQMLEGIRYAVDELNLDRGIAGRRIELLVIDDQGTGEGAATAMRRAAAEGAVAVVGGYDTIEVEGIVPLAKPLQLPVIVAMATGNGLTETSEFVFRNTFTDRQQADVLAAYLWYWRKLLHVSILVDMAPEAVYSRNIARDFAQYFGDLGGTVMRTLEFNGDDFEPAVREVLTYGSGAILVPAEGARAARIVNLLRQRGYRGIVCGPDSWDSEEFFNTLSSGILPGMCVYTAFFSPDNPSPEYRSFSDGFRRRFFHRPGSAAVQGYDAVKLLAAALGDAGDIYRFTDNWLAIQKTAGAAGVYTMLPNGEIDRTIYINTVGRDHDALKPSGNTARAIQYSTLEMYRDEEAEEEPSEDF